MHYDSFSYLWPPRPEKIVTENMFGFYERRGHIAQAKKNGTSNVIAVAPDRTLRCMTRHNDNHKMWLPTEKSSAVFQDLPGKGWYVFCAELLHSKVTEGPRDTNFLHDILVYDGEFLFGETFADRQARLASLFLKGGEKSTTTHHLLNANTWLAKNISTDLAGFFASLTDEIDEGIVIKNPKAPLAFCSRAGANSDWQVKSRKPSKKYFA